MTDFQTLEKMDPEGGLSWDYGLPCGALCSGKRFWTGLVASQTFAGHAAAYLFTGSVALLQGWE